MRAMLGAAVRARLNPTNPVTLARKPRAKKVEIDPFTPDELARLIEGAFAHPSYLLVAVLAGVGCRVGEALALDVTDFDLRAGKLSITKTYSREYGIGPPKSPHSVRTVRVPA